MKIRHRGLNFYNKTRSIAVFLALTFALSVFLAAPGAFANTTPDNLGNISDSALSKMSNDIHSQLNSAKVELDKAEEELKTLNSQIAALEAQIATTQGEISALEGQIAELNAQIDELSEQIAVLEGEIADQNSDLNQRLRLMYEQSDQSMLAVLLDSESFVDFLTNLDMIQKIHESDKEFLEELEKKLDQIEEKKAEIQRAETQLQNDKKTLEEKKARLDEEDKVLTAAKQRAQQIRDEYKAMTDALQAESDRIAAELKDRQTTYWKDFGGAMAWPANGPITSEFGGRMHPVLGYWLQHNGIDIGVPTGTEVHAAADGLVYSVGWNTGGYGNLVMIDHGADANGNPIVTLYAHNSGFAVTAGTEVSRGDVVAYAGSTGRSTGPHVHFEVRVNGTPQNPRGWLG